MRKYPQAALTSLFLFAMPIIAGAQASLSTDSSGNFVGDELGVVKDQSGQTVDLWGTGTTSALAGICPLLKTATTVIAAAMVIIGLFNLFKAARGWGYDGSTHIRRGLILLVAAGGILFLPDVLNLLGMGYLPARGDVQGIWGCLWS